MGTKTAKSGKTNDAIFKLFSNGYKSGRDAYVYNFSQEACVENARKMVGAYLGAVRVAEKRSEYHARGATSQEASIHPWDSKLRNRIARGVRTEFDEANVRQIAYRPFVMQHLFADEFFAQRPAQTSVMFPSDGSKNRAICVPSIGSTRPFSTLTRISHQENNKRSSIEQ